MFTQTVCRVSSRGLESWTFRFLQRVTIMNRQITSMLQAPGSSRATASQLAELVYPELRRLAESLMRRERVDHTWQATALVHEVYVQLVGDAEIGWEGKTHFYAVASHCMRRLLKEYARRRGSLKRGGGRIRVELKTGDWVGSPDVDLEGLDEALELLSELDSRKARVVEMRFLAEMSNDDIALALGVSPRTVERDWRFARAWLLSRLAPA